MTPSHELNATIEIAKALIGQGNDLTANEVADLSSYIVKRIWENVEKDTLGVLNRCHDNERLREEKENGTGESH